MKINNKIVFVIGIICLVLLVALFVADFVYLKDIGIADVAARIAENVLSAGVALSFSMSLSINVKVSNNDVSNNKNSDGLMLKDSNGNAINYSDSSSVFKIAKHGVGIINVGPGMKEFLEVYFDTLVPQQIKNMEDIARKTYEEASKNPSDKELDKDYVMKYIEDSRNISEEDIQDIWVKLLVHGSKNDKEASKRTLDILKNMTSEEAKVFEKIASLSFRDGIIPKLLKGEYDWMSMSLMQDIGLVKSGDITISTLTIPPGKHPLYDNSKIVILLENNGAKDKSFEIECHVLTSEGSELKEALSIQPSNETIIKLAKAIKEEHQSTIMSIKAHHVEHIEGTTITYDDKNDLLNDEM